MKKFYVPRAPAIIGRVLAILRPGEIDMGRRRTRDVAFTYRMGAGFPGDVNRTHPFSVEACLIDVANPPTAYGQAVVIGANNGVRPVAAGDAALTAVYGVTVRPFPLQQSTGGMASAIGAATPPISGVIDVLRLGYVMVQLAGAPAKGDLLYVWAAAAAGADLPGQFTTTTTGGSTIGPLTGSSNFNGPPDTNGVGEIYLSQ